VAFVSVLMAFTPKPVPNWMTGSYLLPYAIDASNIIAALAPRALKDPVRQTIREIRQAWDEEVIKSRKRDQKKDKTDPKSPPPRPVNQ
jgi:hypothetical protein